ncbi:DNA polymerase III subunit alpha [Williamsoniiplasma luminosum]|uniref:DNA-directed DNA polymerase n=1 Tax=Williamsoniiplasma luminosum TaxID=214888 RepID=A0A2S0NL38_9MOLU|nr:DNA polymerase III subunit alpha [Williamsoniiplasma luminosum]AVP49725.1 MAG: DNA polymerase III subunit alpha [Williamsoniiplasma luminosum]
MKFSPQLNVRTEYNFQESLIRIKDYISFAKKHDFSFVFYAENKSMFGVADFYNQAKKNNLKPIIGLAIDNPETNKSTILYAKNKTGFQNLSFLSSWLMENNLTNFDQEFFDVFNQAISDTVLISEDQQMIEKYGAIVHQLFIPKISYLTSDEYENFIVLSAIKNNITLKEISNVQEEHYFSDEEIKNKNAIDQKQQISQIAEACNFNLFDNSGQYHIANFKTPDNLPINIYLKQLCEESLLKYFNESKTFIEQTQYLKRLTYELSVIDKMGFNNYFLIVWDYVKFAKSQDIIVGPGRGSSAGSLVAFLLEITQIDPIKYNLLFERFLNSERATMPDIDIDFQDDRREEVVEYLFNKYGAHNVAMISTFQTIGAKSAIRDVARAYDINLEIVNAITKNIDLNYQNDLKLAVANNAQLKQYQTEYPELFEAANTLIGLPRQTSTHAAGVVLSDIDLRTILPIKIGFNGIYQTQFDMNFLETLGLIKMDILGLRNLTTLQLIQNNILRSRQIKIKLENIDLNIPEVFKTLNAGDTSGIFQLESPGMTNLIKKMEVNSIEDISIASALFRPGPQEMIEEFIERKKGKKQNYLIDQTLKDILSPTFGIIVYQEQVIQILGLVANFSFAKSDIVRRAMGKKDYKYMESMKTEFISQAIKNNYSPENANTIWDWIEKFASYGFNKSHSIAYSYISYWLAYFKTKYPSEFYAALLSGVIGNETKMTQYLNEAKRKDIIVKSPNVANMSFNYNSSQKLLFLPLTTIKGIGNEFIRKLREAYQNDKNLFSSIFYFTTKMLNNGLNKNLFKALIWSGAFDEFKYSRQTLDENIDQIFSFAEFNKNTKIIDEKLVPILDVQKDIPTVVSANEKEYLGFYVSTHPITTIKAENKDLKAIGIDFIKENQGFTRIIGEIQNIKIFKDKNQNDMAFIEVGDETDTISVTIFASLFEQINELIKLNSILAMDVKMQKYKNTISASLIKIIKVLK